MDFDYNPVLDLGSYYVAGSWNDWKFEKMVPVASEPGLHRLEAFLSRPKEEFHIVRDEDWDQVFHPGNHFSDAAMCNIVLGPDHDCYDLNWTIAGVEGDVFVIEFRRVYNSEGESKSIHWRKIRQLDPEELMHAVKRRVTPWTEMQALSIRVEGEE